VNYHIYLLNEAKGGRIETIVQSAALFKEDAYSHGYAITRSLVKKAIQPDGSLIVAAKVQFISPHSIPPSVRIVSDEDLKRAWTEAIGKRFEAPAMTDCSIEVGSHSPSQRPYGSGRYCCRWRVRPSPHTTSASYQPSHPSSPRCSVIPKIL